MYSIILKLDFFLTISWNMTHFIAEKNIFTGCADKSVALPQSVSAAWEWLTVTISVAATADNNCGTSVDPHASPCTSEPPPPQKAVADLGFSLVSPARFQQSSTEEELWLWVSARNSFMWLFCAIYEWQQKQTEREAHRKERWGRGSSWVCCYHENTVSFAALREVLGLWGNRCWSFQGARAVP